MKKVFVAVAGNIGSGKSSLTKFIAESFNWKAYYESVHDNPYLADFYNDMDRWSFNLQIYFLSHRFKIHKQIVKSKASVIQDRSIYEDVEIFAKNLYELGRMKRRDYNNYRRLFSEMIHFLQPPDLLVYLKANVNTLVKQIKLRGREFEKNIDVEYLKKLNKSYDSWIEKYNLGESIVIETDSLDFVKNKAHLEKVLKLIKNKVS